MYEESGCFDPNNTMMVHGSGTATAAAATIGPSEDCFSQIISESDPPPLLHHQAVNISGTATTDTHNHNSFAENVDLSMENLSAIASYPTTYPCVGGGEEYANNNAITATTSSTLINRVAASVATTMEITPHDPQQMLCFHMENTYINHSNNNHGTSSQDLSFHYNNHHQNHQQYPYNPTPTPDLLNLLHLPKSPASPYGNNSSLSFENPTHNTNTNTNLFPIMGAESTNVSSVSYDPLLHLNLQQQQAPLPQDGYTIMPPSRNDFVFGEEGEYEYLQDGDHDHGVLEITQDLMNTCVGKKRGGKRTKVVPSNTTEKQRRVDLGIKFDALKELIPNLTKSDRASVVGDAIEYIRELRRTVNELKILAENKRHERQRRIKRHKVEEGATDEGDLNLKLVDDQPYNESLRSSWIQRKSRDTEVDVRIVDDEVTIKLVQRKKINCLVYASQALDELKLDLQHVAGGHIGDFCSLMLNSKIFEGSTVYASAIANKLIEVMDRSLAAA